MLDVSNTTVPTQFLLHHEYGAPLVSGHANWMPVSLRVPLNESSATSTAHCVEFQTGPGSSAPVAVKPCMLGWDASATGSQLFVYDIASSQISPYWPSLWNNTNGSSMPSSASPTPLASPNGVQTRSSASNMAPANLHFNPSSTPKAVTFANTRLGSSDVDDDNDDDDDVASGGSVDESGVVTTNSGSRTGSTPSDMQFEGLLATDDTPPSTSAGEVGADTSSGSSSPHNPAVLAAADDTAPSSVPSTVPTPADPTAPCSDGDVTCIGDQFAECAGAAWVLTTCGPGTVCRIVPEWGTPGAGVVPTCDTPEDAALRNGDSEGS